MHSTTSRQADTQMKDIDPGHDVDAEISWVHLTEQGAAQLAEGNAHAARESWQQAHAIAAEFAGYDPRLAASINNVGVGHRMIGDFAQAERSYQLALHTWDAAGEWVEHMQISAHAGSSLFHMRMENRHREQYRRNAVAGFQRELGAGQAASLNNLAELLHAAERPDDARKLYTEALEQRGTALQGNDPGAQAIARNIALLSPAPAESDAIRSPIFAGSRPFSEQAEQNRWIVDLPPMFTDEGRLMAALLCTYVLDHAAAAKAGS